ncbi:MAG: TIGR00730 family Rossman fold protein [Muribaculaceae bacterium]
MSKYKNICVFGASSPNTPKEYLKVALILGTLIARSKSVCICGAGRAGVMGAVIDGALKYFGAVIGVIPQFMVDNGWHNPMLKETIVTPDMHSRKQAMIDQSDAFIAMPGGCGTFEELMEVITWKQLGLFSKPIIILNVYGFYDSLIALFEKSIEEKFMKIGDSKLWSVATTPEEAMEILENYDETLVEKQELKY